MGHPSRVTPSLARVAEHEDAAGAPAAGFSDAHGRTRKKVLAAQRQEQFHTRHGKAAAQYVEQTARYAAQIREHDRKKRWVLHPGKDRFLNVSAAPAPRRPSSGPAPPVAPRGSARTPAARPPLTRSLSLSLSPLRRCGTW
jgi:hypothetical protein